MIATNVGGLAEIIHHEKTGLIAPTPDVETIKATILDYFNSYETKTFIGNIKQLKHELSWKVFAEKLVELNMAI